MSKYQNMIIWIGLILVCIYLFTNTSFKASLFGTGSGDTTAVKALHVSAGTPSSTGNTQSNSGSPKVTIV